MLFGGRDGSQTFGDTWEWDGNSWQEIKASGPTPREGARMAFNAQTGQIVLFGGGRAPSADTWAWDGAQWSKVATNGPPGRAYHAMAYDAARGKIVLFGGYDGQNNRADTWEWDGRAWACAAGC